MNADGSNQRRLTNSDKTNSWYASLAPDGQSVVFSSNESGAHEIYEMDLAGNASQLTSIGEAYAPEISPDGKHIVFTNAHGTYSSIWIVNRDGANPHRLYRSPEHDAVGANWSPDGTRILFAVGEGDTRHLYTMGSNGTDVRIVSDSFTTGGRSDWSPLGTTVVSYTGGTWARSLISVKPDGSGLTTLYAEGNAQAPSFSPDGAWVAFTGYVDNMGNDNGCEIYILRLADSQLRRLTQNSFCDWQPRWGP